MNTEDLGKVFFPVTVLDISFDGCTLGQDHMKRAGAKQKSPRDYPARTVTDIAVQSAL